jgi:hypothetical protein
VLYVDSASGELRHGPIETSPANVLFMADETSAGAPRQGWLMNDMGERREPIVCSANCSWSAFGTSVTAKALRLVPLTHGLVGLRSEDRYLGAEPDGRITLSRAWCSLWECFLPSESWCTVPLAAVGEENQDTDDATIDWGRISSFTIDPNLKVRSGTIIKARSLVVAVYTIALNEAAHVERWAKSAVDADYRIVTDTGSADDTVELLTQAGVTVHRIAVRPWRFDVARNAALALIPADVNVCVSMDMDEFLEPGWRPQLEAAWTAETTALFCRLAARASLDDPMPRVWPSKKFHARWGYRFRRAVHEELVYTAGNEVAGDCPGILVHHIQDRNKATRSQYLPLLELAHKEDPEDSQICFWLGRDYQWSGRPDRGVETLQRYLALQSSTWTEERSEAMRCLARMQPDQRMAWLDKARIEAPHRREIWLDLAQEFRDLADWPNLFCACVNGIETTHRTGSYLDDAYCWGAPLFDLGAIACYHLNVMDRAVEWGRKALELDPSNQRLRDNFDFFTRRRKEVRLGIVTVSPDSPRTPLLTTFGTVLYVEVASGQLRHGAIDSSPVNAVFAADRYLFEGSRTGWLTHDGGDALRPIGCSADGCWAASEAEISCASIAPTALELLPIERGLVGLRSGGLYLCAEPDGRITLSRTVCSRWECFLAVEDWCTAPSETSAKQGRHLAGGRVDWPGIRSIIISPNLGVGSRNPPTP